MKFLSGITKVVLSPIEINKKIASLKGLTINQKFADDHGDTKAVYLVALPPDFVAGWRNWAEDIRQAWELFEEMRSSVLMMDRYGGSYSRGKYLCADDYYEAFDVANGDDVEAIDLWNSQDNPLSAAETAPLAICKAWIRWKETK